MSKTIEEIASIAANWWGDSLLDVTNNDAKEKFISILTTMIKNDLNKNKLSYICYSDDMLGGSLTDVMKELNIAGFYISQYSLPLDTSMSISIDNISVWCGAPPKITQYILYGDRDFLLRMIKREEKNLCKAKNDDCNFIKEAKKRKEFKQRTIFRISTEIATLKAMLRRIEE